MIMKRMLGTNTKERLYLFVGVLCFAFILSVQISYAQEEHTHTEGHMMDVDPAMYDELRAKSPGFANRSNQEIMGAMMAMGENYDWYVSDESVTGDIGVLMLTHGAREAGDKIVKEAIEPLAEIYPVSVSYGMAMMTSSHIQASVDNLVAAGAKKIVVVPTTSTEYTDLTRQWEYIVGKRSEAVWVTVPQIQTDAEIILAQAPNGHSIISQILLDNAEEISTKSRDEVVIIVGHGPVSSNDNEFDMLALNTYAAYLAKNSKFHDVLAINLQDDAAEPVRSSNVALLRSWLRSAKAQDKEVLIVGALLFTQGIQRKIHTDLEGLDYKFNENGLSGHPKFSDWIAATVAEQVGKS